MACFAISFGVFFPLQVHYLPAIAAYAMLLFLPHGVRVLTAWLYGWCAVFLLAPAAILTQLWLFGWDSMTLDKALGNAVGICSASIAFALLRFSGRRSEDYTPKGLDWLLVLTASVIASLINSVGTNFFFGGTQASAVSYLIGDVSGTIILMILLAAVFRTLRRLGH